MRNGFPSRRSFARRQFLLCLWIHQTVDHLTLRGWQDVLLNALACCGALHEAATFLMKNPEQCGEGLTDENLKNC